MTETPDKVTDTNVGNTGRLREQEALKLATRWFRDCTTKDTELIFEKEDELYCCFTPKELADLIEDREAKAKLKVLGKAEDSLKFIAGHLNMVHVEVIEKYFARVTSEITDITNQPTSNPKP